MSSEEWAEDFWSQGVKKGSWREWKMRVEIEVQVFWVQYGERAKKVMSRTVVTAMIWEALLRLGLFSQIGETVLSLIMGAVVVLISGSAAWFLSEFAVDDDDNKPEANLLGEEDEKHDLKHRQQRQQKPGIDGSTPGLSDIDEEDADDEDQSGPDPEPESSSSSSSSEDEDEDEYDQKIHYEGSDYVYEYESDYSEYQPRRRRRRPSQSRSRSRSRSRLRSRNRLNSRLPSRSRSRLRLRRRGRSQNQTQNQSRSRQDLDFEVEYLSSFSLGSGVGYSYGGGDGDVGGGGSGNGPRYGQEGGEGYISSWSGRGSD